MLREFNDYRTWKAAVDAADCAVDLTPSHDYPHPSDLTDPVEAYTIIREGRQRHYGSAVGIWFPTDSEGVLADDPYEYEQWQQLTHLWDDELSREVDLRSMLNAAPDRGDPPSRCRDCGTVHGDDVFCPATL